MKRLLLFVMAVMAFAGMTVAQDIYSSGYYTSGGKQYAAVYKNGTKLHETYFGERPCSSEDVVVFNGDVYWVQNCMNADGTAHFGDVFKNNNRWLNNYTSDGTHINDLFAGTSFLFSAGYKTTGGKKVAVMWRGNDSEPFYTMGNGSTDSEVICGLIHDSWAYMGGYQGTDGMIWKGTSVIKQIANTKIVAISSYNGKLWFVGKENAALKVWSMNTDGTNLSVVYTLVSSGASDRARMYIEAGDVYVTAYGGSSPDILWKNGTQLYTTGGYFYGVAANSNGVYSVGSLNSAGKIWKNGSVLYTPSNCEKLYGLYIAEPECTNSAIRSLPFTEGFENGNTSWPCWTKIDSDNNNGDVISYWTRWGKGMTSYVTYGNHCAGHRWNGSNNQEGWLISPQLFLQPGRDETTLTFKSYEGGVSDYKYEGVWISTTGTATSNFTQVWTQSNPTDSWKTVTIDLTAYQGHAVYIAFKYTGTNGHTWLIDDVSVTESWETCSNQSVPYSSPFSSYIGGCWYIVDEDMSGDKRCWQYNSSEQCAYHPYGQSGIAQYGYLYSPNINLPAGHDYVLKFKTKSTSSGSGKSNKIWVRTDGTGIPETSDYRDEIWSDNQFSSSWTDVEVPISEYAGHNISLEFNYQGTYAHNWFIKDVRVEQTIVQYTITANANNNSWGSVSGGGTYNNGATCTLTATPASGYQFQNWKKNGTIVSTNANYSFTVTENATYTATFGEIPINYYTITTAASPTVGGTVSGGGTFQEGSSTTLTATANTGYSFSKWQDNNTTNPRTITVTQNATYTATFTQDHYTVSVYASPASGGTVSGGGSNFTYGSTATLTATPASGYEFQGWSDGSTDNPHTVTVFGNATYTATFGEEGTTYFSVTTSVTPEGSGTVTGGGTYEAGEMCSLTATANTGYDFFCWKKNGTTMSMNTSYAFTVNDDTHIVAEFQAKEYSIVVVAEPTNGGTVDGSGTYTYGSTATLRATPASGYEFQGWSDGSTENPHQVTVTGNATYKAIFTPVGATYYTVSAVVSPAGSGSVTGTGVFAAGSTTTLRATANEGYTFKRWNDNSTMNPRQVTVNNNMSFTAFFEAQQYTITVDASPAAGGTVTGGGSYAYGATATLRATPNANYTFTRWNDGVVQNPRTVTVTENASYTAIFATEGGQTYTLTLTVNDPSLGTVMGGGSYPAGTPVQITAYPNAGAEFVRWSDGNTRNPRTVRVDSDMTLEAEFASAATYTITVNSADPTMGQAFGGGTYHIGETVEISALANSGYEFMRWNDGNSDNPRTITVTGDATYTATFAATGTETHRVILICNGDDGTVTGDGVYVHGATAIIQAFPAADRVFDKWSDGSTDNPRSLTVNEDITLVAFFRTAGVDENGESYYELYPNPTNTVIRIAGIEDNTEVNIYNTLGMLVKVVRVSSDEEITVSDLSAGLYLVRFGNVSLRFVKTL